MANILIVDNDLQFAKSIARVLKNGGFQTSIVTSGFEAGVSAVNLKPDLMTLDLQMPGMHGFQVLKAIRQISELSDVKVLVVSAGSDQTLDSMRNYGADDVLQKPFDNENLISKVNRLLDIS